MNKVAIIFTIIAATYAGASIAASSLKPVTEKTVTENVLTNQIHYKSEKKETLRLLIGVTPSIKGDSKQIAKKLVTRANIIFGDANIAKVNQVELAGVYPVTTDSSDYYSLLSSISAEGKSQDSFMDFYDADLMIIMTGQADASGMKGYANSEAGYAISYHPNALNERTSFIHELGLLLKAEQNKASNINSFGGVKRKERSQSSASNAVEIYYTGTGLADHAMPGQVKSYSANITGGQVSSIKWYYQFSTYEDRNWTLVHDYILGSSNVHFSKKFRYSEAYGAITVKCEVTFDTGEVVEDLHYIEWDNFLR